MNSGLTLLRWFVNFFFIIFCTGWLLTKEKDVTECTSKQPLTERISPFKSMLGERTFEIQTLRPAKNIWRTEDVHIPVRMVTANNKHLVPPFHQCGFEFLSLSESAALHSGDISRNDYYKMLERVSSMTRYSRGRSTWSLSSIMKHHPTLESIVNEFGDRHSMNLRINSVKLSARNAESSKKGWGIGTPIHFDGRDNDFRLWIPLTCTKIDNLLLGVGDISRVNDGRRCALPQRKRIPGCDAMAFEQINWYQFKEMDSEDWIFYRTAEVPHFSVDLEQSTHRQCKTKRRFALIVSIEEVNQDLSIGPFLRRKRI